MATAPSVSSGMLITPYSIYNPCLPSFWNVVFAPATTKANAKGDIKKTPRRYLMGTPLGGCTFLVQTRHGAGHHETCSWRDKPHAAVIEGIACAAAGVRRGSPRACVSSTVSLDLYSFVLGNGIAPGAL